MKILFILALLSASSACAQRRPNLAPIPVKPPGTTSAVQKGQMDPQLEIDYLKAQLALANQENEISNIPNVRKVRQAVLETGTRYEAAAKTTAKDEKKK